MLMFAQQGLPDIDVGLWIYLILGALSLFGGIFGKKKKQEAEEKEKLAQLERKSARKPAQPVPHRRPAPQPPIPPVARGAAKPQPPAAADRQTLKIPGLPYEIRLDTDDDELVEVELVPEPARPSARAPQSRTRRPAAMPQPRQSADIESPPLASLANVAVLADEPPTASNRRPGVDRREIRRMLHDKTSIRSAFVLSELLAPPVSMRQNQ